MINDDARAFNKEFGDLLRKYKLRGFVGLIYEGNTSELRTGLLRIYDPADTGMKTITGLISVALTEMNSKAMGSTPSFEYRDLTGGPGKEKN